MKIGLSLSFCVKDILKGKVRLEDVECLITGTRMESAKDFDKMLDRYCCTYWDFDPEKGKQIAAYLWSRGKIHQPRIDSPTDDLPKWHNDLMSRGVRWLTVEGRYAEEVM